MNKHARATSGGKAAAFTNRRFHLRRVVGEDEQGREVFECGHRMYPREDMAGRYYATRRRCPWCPRGGAHQDTGDSHVHD